ncbi:MAG: ATP-binding protein [Chloroflexi bacterium]|nr:ATP-binding protein [Chloroflexota bacterium]
MASLDDHIRKQYNSIWDQPIPENPEPPQEVCPYCGGFGMVTKDVPVGHPDFGRAFMCVCRQAAAVERKADHLRSISNLAHYKDLNFDAFATTGESLNGTQSTILRNSIDAAYRYANAPEGWLLFLGGYGCGKTHLAAAIGNHRLLYNQPAIFLTVPDLLDHLRTGFSPNAEQGYDEMFEQLRDAPLLILDDLGSESQTAWANEKLYQLFNYRYTRRLPTVVTTNCDIDQLDPRIASRLVDRNLTNLINMQGLPDYRRHPEAQSASEISNLKIYMHRTFENFATRRPGLSSEANESLAKALRMAKAFAAYPDDKWLILVGKNGCGKTHLAAAIANARSKSGESVYFITLPDFLDYLRKSFDANSRSSLEKRFQEVCNARVLILDHFDLSAASAWAKEKVFQLIEYRYVQSLPTVITKTGDSIDDLEPVFRARLSDPRLCEVIYIMASEFKGGVSITPNANNKPRPSN